MFQPSFARLLYYPQLLSKSFVMNVTDIYRSHVVISCCDLSSMGT
jgi:hypothetical protein